MTWTLFYLVCFFLGVSLSVMAFLGGSWHLPHLHVHLPHAGGHLGGATSPSASSVQTAHHGGMSVFNFGTLTAFLAWFGGTGYLLTRYSSLVVTLIVSISAVAGITGASVVFLFVAKFLMAHSRELDPADYDRVGALGRITSSIREGGTGEITFSLAGTRHACGARAENGAALARGAEVIVTRYERGIAYVRRYEELAGEKEAPATD